MLHIFYVDHFPSSNLIGFINKKSNLWVGSYEFPLPSFPTATKPFSPSLLFFAFYLGCFFFSFYRGCFFFAFYRGCFPLPSILVGFVCWLPFWVLFLCLLTWVQILSWLFFSLPSIMGVAFYLGCFFFAFYLGCFFFDFYLGRVYLQMMIYEKVLLL